MRREWTVVKGTGDVTSNAPCQRTLMYETRGRDDRATLLMVVVVRTVSRPMYRDTLGTHSLVTLWSLSMVNHCGHSLWSLTVVTQWSLSGHSVVTHSGHSLSDVSRPMETRAGLASTLIQNDTHDRITIRIDGT